MTGTSAAVTVELSSVATKKAEQRVLAIVRANQSVFRQDFPAYAEANMALWRRFERETNRLWESGARHGGARTIMEHIRFETALREKSGEFKINNSFVPDFARLYGFVHPDRDNFFECRTLVGITIRQQIRQPLPEKEKEMEA